MIESIGLTENGNLCGEVVINNIQCHFFVRKEFCSSEYLLESGGEAFTITLGFGPLWFEPGMAILGEWPEIQELNNFFSKKKLKINDQREVVDEARKCWVDWEEIKEWYSLR